MGKAIQRVENRSCSGCQLCPTRRSHDTGPWPMGWRRSQSIGNQRESDSGRSGCEPRIFV